MRTKLVAPGFDVLRGLGTRSNAREKNVGHD
jgi:hypothetical protein